MKSSPTLLRLVHEGLGQETGTDAVADALAVRGWKIHRADINSVRSAGGQLHVALLDRHPESPDYYVDPANYDLLWLHGFGNASSTINRFSLLETLANTTFVTAPFTMLAGHGKTAQQGPLPQGLHWPLTYCSDDAHWLHTQLDHRSWVLKPASGSKGIDVERLPTDSRGRLNRLETATQRHGLVVVQAEIALANAPRDIHFQDIPEAPAHRAESAQDSQELRVVICAGKVIGAYARIPVSGEFRANREHAEIARAKLDSDRLRRCQDLAEELMAQGIGYAGIDMRYPWLLEINVANPGGIGTLIELGDTTVAHRCAEAIDQRFR